MDNLFTMNITLDENRPYIAAGKLGSTYFDTKHYTFQVSNVVNWARKSGKLIELPLEDFVRLLSFHDTPPQLEKLGKFIGRGSEAVAFKKNNKVYKIIFDDGFDKGQWSIAHEKITKHNRVFPETAYKVAYVIHCPWSEDEEKIIDGPDIALSEALENIIYDYSNTDYWPVLCQEALDTNVYEELLDKDDKKIYVKTPIDDFLAKKGFKQLNYCSSPGRRVYKRGKTYLDDVRVGNIGYDDEGNLKIFDAILGTDHKKYFTDNTGVYRKLKRDDDNDDEDEDEDNEEIFTDD
jgi:hypothetical protein